MRRHPERIGVRVSTHLVVAAGAEYIAKLYELLGMGLPVASETDMTSLAYIVWFERPDDAPPLAAELVPTIESTRDPLDPLGEVMIRVAVKEWLDEQGRRLRCDVSPCDGSTASPASPSTATHSTGSGPSASGQDATVHRADHFDDRGWCNCGCPLCVTQVDGFCQCPHCTCQMHNPRDPAKPGNGYTGVYSGIKPQGAPAVSGPARTNSS